MDVSEFLTRDHRGCDDQFTALEDVVIKADWPQTSALVKAFSTATLEHFRFEEEVLFPALEAAMGQRLGPTEVMRLEHAEMRSLLDELAHAVGRHDTDAINGIVDTLVILMQQHNAKEEQVLYPLADRLLGSQKAELIAKRQAMGQ